MGQPKTIINRWLLIILLAGVFLPGRAQIIDFPYIDSVTYHHYVNHKWEAVVANGKIGLENHIDYYYLRMRIGEAYYAMEKYALAIPHFKKALEFSHQDKSASAYLYYSYINMGMSSRAYRLGMSFNEHLKQSLDIKPKPVELIDVFGGYTFSNNESRNSQISLLRQQDDFGKQTLIGNQIYMHAGLTFHFSPSFSLYLSGSYLDIARTNRFEYRIEEQTKGVPVYANDGWIVNRFESEKVTYDQSFEGRIRQYEYYANAKIQMANGLSLNLFGNLLSINAPVIDNEKISVIKTDTLTWHPATGEVQAYAWTKDSMVFTETDTSFVNWVAGVNLQKDFNTVTINVFGTFSQLTESYQGQVGMSLLYYPLGSTLFYGKTELTGFFESGEIYGNEKRLIFCQKLGIKLFKNTWLEGEYMAGNLHNVNRNQGMIVYNLPEKINFIAGLNLHIFATKHLAVSLMYNYSDKQGNYKTENMSSDTETFYSFKYQTQSIIGGIKWTF